MKILFDSNPPPPNDQIIPLRVDLCFVMDHTGANFVVNVCGAKYGPNDGNLRSTPFPESTSRGVDDGDVGEAADCVIDDDG